MKVQPITGKQYWRTCETCGRRLELFESHRHLSIIVDPTIPNDRILIKYGEQIVGQFVNVRA